MRVNQFGVTLKKIIIFLVFGFLFVSVVKYPQLSTNSETWKQEEISKMYNKYSKDFPEVEDISVEELKLLQQKETVILIDVRTSKERAISIIPGAISQTEFEQNIDRYKNYTLVTYCTIGYRSGKYSQLWHKKGINILNLKGSILAWTHAQGELVNNLGQTKNIHVFGKQWKLADDNYQSTW